MFCYGANDPKRHQHDVDNEGFTIISDSKNGKNDIYTVIGDNSTYTHVEETFRNRLEVAAHKKFNQEERVVYRQYRYLTTQGFEKFKQFFLCLLAGGFSSNSPDLCHSQENESYKDWAAFYGQCCKVQALYNQFKEKKRDQTYEKLYQEFTILHEIFDHEGNRDNTELINQVLSQQLDGKSIAAEMLEYFAEKELTRTGHFEKDLKDFYGNYQQHLNRASLFIGQGVVEKDVRVAFQRALDKVLQGKNRRENTLNILRSLEPSTEEIEQYSERLRAQITEMLKEGKCDQELSRLGMVNQDQEALINNHAQLEILLNEKAELNSTKKELELEKIKIDSYLEKQKADSVFYSYEFLFNYIQTKQSDPVTFLVNLSTLLGCKDFANIYKHYSESDAKIKEVASVVESLEEQAKRDKLLSLTDRLKDNLELLKKEKVSVEGSILIELGIGREEYLVKEQQQKALQESIEALEAQIQAKEGKMTSLLGKDFKYETSADRGVVYKDQDKIQELALEKIKQDRPQALHFLATDILKISSQKKEAASLANTEKTREQSSLAAHQKIDQLALGEVVYGGSRYVAIWHSCEEDRAALPVPAHINTEAKGVLRIQLQQLLNTQPSAGLLERVSDKGFDFSGHENIDHSTETEKVWKIFCSLTQHPEHLTFLLRHPEKNTYFHSFEPVNLTQKEEETVIIEMVKKFEQALEPVDLTDKERTVLLKYKYVDLFYGLYNVDEFLNLSAKAVLLESQKT